jgi:glycosyltransferase involved in cell wall biosynthesis
MTPVLRRKMETVPGVEVVGEVADVRPYARRAAAAVAPLRIGSGTRLKILEAMSQGLPVVSTRKGAEGIEASNGRHLFLADEPSDIADSVLRLLADEGLYRTFQQEGRRLVESRYDWDLVGDAAEAALHDTLDRVRRGGR